MTLTPSFSDLLTQLAEAHASEIQSLRDEYVAAMASGAGTGDYKGDCMASEVRSLHVPQENGSPPKELFDVSMQQFEAARWQAKRPKPLELPRQISNSSPSSPGHRAQLSPSSPGYSYPSTRKTSRAHHILRDGWSRDKIWGTDDITLTKSGQDAENDHPAVNRRLSIHGVEAQVSVCVGCHGCVIFPTSTFRTCWDLASLFFIVIDILTLPFVFAFDPQPTEGYTVISWLSLIFWTADMLQGPFLGYFDNGEYIKAKWRVFKHYLKTWFVIDVVVVGPEWMAIIVNRTTDSAVSDVSGLLKVFKSVRIVRVLRLLRVAKIRKLIDSLYDFSNGEASFVMLNVLQLVIFLLILNHVLACAWYKVGTSTQSTGDNWVKRVLTFDGDSSQYYLYLTAMHWSLTQFTPASMDVSACNETERLFSIIVLFCAMIVFSSFVGSITNHITRLRALTSDSTKQLWLLRRFLREHDVSPSLSFRIKKYVEHKLSLEAGQIHISEMEILSKLSAALSDELTYDLHSRYICAHPFFNCLGNNMGLQVKLLHRICQSALRVEDYAKHEVVFSPGDEGKCMLIVQSGELEYLRTGLGVVNMSVEGTVDDLESVQWIAEAVLWTAWRHRGDLHVTYQCELIAIDPDVFYDVMTKHPRSWLYACVYGEKFIKFLNSLDHLTDAITSKTFYKEAAEHANYVSSNDQADDEPDNAQAPELISEVDSDETQHTGDERKLAM